MSNRNSYRNWTPAEIVADTQATWNRLKFNGVLVSDLVDRNTGKPVPMFYLDYVNAVERCGLKLVDVKVTHQTNDDGSIAVDKEGKPIVESRDPAPYDIVFNVKMAGFVDCDGREIVANQKQYFIVTREATNRQPTPSNVDDLALRLDHWAFNLETLTKDEEGNGQNEQHRCLAVIKDCLTGANRMPSGGIPTITLDGVSVGAAGSIDTGKQKSATDDLTSNHELLAPVLPLRYEDYRDNTTLGYGAESKQERVRILRELQGTAKRVVLRMLGANIKGSKFSGYASAGNVQTLATRWEGFDELLNMVQVMVNVIPQKVDKKQMRPVKTWEVATAYALWLLRDAEPLTDAQSLVEYDFPEIDLEPLKEFLNDIIQGVLQGTGPLAAWCKDRVSPSTLKHTDEQSFAQVMRALQNFMQGGEVSPDINRDLTSKDKENGQKFFHFGGADRGPIAKEKKSKA